MSLTTIFRAPKSRWLVVWMLAILPLLGWWTYGLFDVDEGFYGAVVAEMNRRGEWVTPYYNGQPWFEKPILLYWLAKPCMAAFGDMFGPRLPCILTAISTYATIAWFANRRFGAVVAQLATLMLAGCLLVIGTGRLMMTDMPLLACLTGAMVTFWESLVGRPSWRIWTAGLLGLGVLAKGPVALILFALIAGWTYWREPELRPAFKGEWLLGTALLSLVITIWYVPAYIANGHDFVQKFLVEQNIGRFTGGDAAHTLRGPESLVLYIPILLLGMFPWSLFLWHAWPKRKRAVASVSGALERYLATWGATVFLFFTISGAKLPHYILPTIPPLVLLVAVYAIRFSPTPQRWFAVSGCWCVVTAIIAQVVFTTWYKASGQAEVHAIARYVRKQRFNVAIYQMGRREKGLGTGKLKLMETSLPSLLMVLDQKVLDTDDFKKILEVKRPVLIITRNGRIQPADYAAAIEAGQQLGEIRPPTAQDAFKLYLLRRTPAFF